MGRSNQWRQRVNIRGLYDNQDGQDMIEYALMAALVAISVAAFIPYGILPSLSTIYSRLLYVASVLVP
jgi:Flp pilus assembly pilin Flp